MQASNDDDVSFGQWLLRTVNDPSLHGVIDLSQCSVLWTRFICSLTAEELGQLKLALQSNSNVRVLKLCPPITAIVRTFRMSLNVDGIREIAEPLGKLTALQQLYISRKISISILICEGYVLRLRERDMRGVWLCFSLACQGMSLCLKGQGLCRSRSAS